MVQTMAAANQEWDKRRKTKLLKEIGLHIKSLRLKKGLTGAEFARQLSMERSHVSRMEAGGTNPTIVLIFKICEVLEMSPGEFWTAFKEKSKENLGIVTIYIQEKQFYFY